MIALLLLLSACMPKVSAVPTDLTRSERQALQLDILAADRALQQTPLAADAPVWRDQMVVGYLQLGLLDSAQSHVDLMTTLCGPGSIWRTVHEGSPLVLERADLLIEQDLRRITLGWDQFQRYVEPDDARRLETAQEQIRRNCATYDHLYPQDPRRAQISAVCEGLAP
ncbi:MAG: hypothetical protein H6741_24085 [Alphaproteobacteria bacterium]|nr:hypothetical protein [Alphaproteobacteria bacterium]MCB9795787.1 hypothetical protein [Alphaproteobacteria bacterium]